jgi:DNA-binding MarR family transcriptional regulator
VPRKVSSRASRRKPKKTVPARNEFLAGYLPYLLNRVVRAMLRGVDQKFQERGLTVSKWRTLAVLSDRGTCGFGELATLTSIQPATLSRFIDGLAAAGLVRRRRSASDARAVRIALTEKGEAAFTETLPWASDVENRLVRGIEPEDAAKLKVMLKQMFSNIRADALEDEEGDEFAAVDAGLLDL